MSDRKLWICIVVMNFFLVSFRTGIVCDSQIRSQGDSEANARLLTFQLKSGGNLIQPSHVLF